MTDHRDDLERTEELFRFLQGDIPDGYKIPKDRIPKLTPLPGVVPAAVSGSAASRAPNASQVPRSK